LARWQWRQSICAEYGWRSDHSAFTV
jgi:hypothetical protein